MQLSNVTLARKREIYFVSYDQEEKIVGKLLVSSAVFVKLNLYHYESVRKLKIHKCALQHNYNKRLPEVILK